MDGIQTHIIHNIPLSKKKNSSQSFIYNNAANSLKVFPLASTELVPYYPSVLIYKVDG